MDVTEFDKFAASYRDMHQRNIAVTGETPDFFAEYKIRDVAGVLARDGMREDPAILDFGCGIGAAIPFVRAILPKARLTGLDVSRKSLEVAGERFPGAAELVAFDGETIPFEAGSFDVVFTACVFHHIPETHHVPLLTEIRRILRPGGQFFIFEHNPRNPLTVHAVNTCPFDENAVLIDAATLSGRIRAAGFAGADTRYRIFVPRMLRALRPLEPYLTWLPLGAQYYIRARA